MNELERLEDQLLDIEARVGLLEACRPVGALQEEQRLEEQLRRAAPDPKDLVPATSWPRRPSLELENSRVEQVERACSRLMSGSDAFARVARILVERAQELALEVEMVNARGTPRLIALAATRFVGASGETRAAADRLAHDWLSECVSLGTEPLADTVPLAAELVRLARNAGLAIEVLEVEMAARAAVTETALLVRAGARATRSQAIRTFTHEVYGHWMPRAAAKKHGCPFRIGPRGADADEEGRALHLEMLSGHVNAERRMELAARHLLAGAVLDGGHPGEALLALRGQGVPVTLLANLAPRVFRAGGLCREIVYLPGLLRVETPLGDPEVERVFRAGRATLAELDTLRALLPVPHESTSATTGV